MSVTFSCRLQPATLLKVTLLHGCFPRFLNSTSGSQSHYASQISYFTCTVDVSQIINPFLACVPNVYLAESTRKPKVLNGLTHFVLSPQLPVISVLRYSGRGIREILIPVI